MESSIIMEKEILLPVDFINNNGSFSIVSFRLPETNFVEPFSIDTLSRQFNILDTNFSDPEDSLKLARPLHYDLHDSRVELTPVEDFLKSYSRIESELPRKFIFHMSRCGSTLVTQMLATSDRFHVLVEPTIINKLMDPAVKLPVGLDRMEIFKAAIKALEKTAPKQAKEMVFKFRSWNSLYMPEMTMALPGTKWLFTHRNGLEVLASVLQDPPGWLRSRPTHQKYFEPYLSKEDGEDLSLIPDDEYAIRLLGAFCKAAAEVKFGNGEFIEYTQIKEKLPDLIEKNWGIDLSEAEKTLMLERTAIYSKDPEKSREFSPDSELKQTLATEHQRSLASKFIEAQRGKLMNERPSWTRELRPRLI